MSGGVFSVERDAIEVYAEGVIHGLEKALADLKHGRSIKESLAAWRIQYTRAQNEAATRAGQAHG